MKEDIKAIRVALEALVVLLGPISKEVSEKAEARAVALREYEAKRGAVEAILMRAHAAGVRKVSRRIS